MKYTKEDIEKMKSDPWMRLLCMLAGKDIDEIINEIESNDTISDPDKGVVVKPLQEKAVPKKVFPISKENYDFLVKCALEYNRSINDMAFGGFTIDTKNLNLVGAPLAMVYCLLRTLCGDYFAGKFMAGLSKGNDCVGKEYFDMLYDDETRIY